MSIRKSLVYSYLDRYASLVLGVASSIFIARLLTPADIGVFSVTMVLLSYAASVRDMGAGGYLVQEKELTTDRIRAVWAVQLGLGLGLSLVIAAASVFVADFYNDQRMVAIMLVLALNYAINPFGSLTYAWQMREMQFDRLALIRFSSTLVGSAVSVFLAWRGMGPLALALGALTGTASNAALAMFYRPRHFPWLPGTREIRRVLGFGSRTTGASILATLGGSAPELLLGKLQGMAATGLFSRASGLVAMFDRLVMSGISSVAIPWFARQSHEHGDLGASFLKSTGYVCAVAWSFAVGLGLLAFPAVRLLYGNQWDESVNLVRILCLGLAVAAPAAMCQTLLLAVGEAGTVLRVTLHSTIAAVALCAIGAVWSNDALATALVLAGLLRTILSLRAAQRRIGFEWSALRRQLLPCVGVAMVAAVGPLLATAAFGLRPESLVPILTVAVPTSAVGFFAGLLLFKHPLCEELPFLRRRNSAQH